MLVLSSESFFFFPSFFAAGSPIKPRLAINTLFNPRWSCTSDFSLPPAPHPSGGKGRQAGVVRVEAATKVGEARAQACFCFLETVSLCSADRPRACFGDQASLKLRRPDC